jgi:hypothetical protein
MVFFQQDFQTTMFPDGLGSDDGDDQSTLKPTSAWRRGAASADRNS